MKGSHVQTTKLTAAANGKHPRQRRRASQAAPRRTQRSRSTPPRRPAHPDAYVLHLEERMELLLKALTGARDGDLDVSMPGDGDDDLASRVSGAFNGLVDRLRR